MSPSGIQNSKGGLLKIPMLMVQCPHVGGPNQSTPFLLFICAA